MAHYCICAICNERFDRDKVQAVRHGARRYAHQGCFPQGEIVPLANVKDTDLIALEEYIMKLYNVEYVPPRMRKQINSFIEENKYSYSGILKTLTWWYEIKKNDIKDSHGSLNIVPYIYEDAKAYYYSLYLAEEKNKQKDIIAYKELPSIEVTISLPKVAVKKHKFFNLEEDEL